MAHRLDPIRCYINCGGYFYVPENSLHDFFTDSCDCILINNVSFERVDNRKHFLMFHLFKEINCGGSFYVPENSLHDFFTDCCLCNFFLTRESVCLHSIETDKLMFSLYAIIYDDFTKTCFSIHITYSPVNFTSFASSSHQKFDDRPLFRLGALHLICCHFK